MRCKESGYFYVVKMCGRLIGELVLRERRGGVGVFGVSEGLSVGEEEAVCEELVGVLGELSEFGFV